MLLEDLIRQMQTGQIAIPGGSAPAPQRMPVGGPAPAPAPSAQMPGPASPLTPKPQQAGTFAPNPLASMARGYSSGGLVGAIGNMMEEPQMIARAQAAEQKKAAEASALQNQTAQFLRSRMPDMSPEDAAIAARNPAILQPLLKQLMDPNADLSRRKTEAEIAKLQADAKGIDPDRMTKGAGDGMMWKDPSNPAMGVVPIPGATPKKPKSVGQEALDKMFAKEYGETFIGGGFADAQKNLNAVREVAKTLEDPDGPNLSGGGFALIPEFAQDVVTPTAAAARQNVEEVVQRNLRVILGAQFTNEEGKRLIARAYNINQPEAENAKRLTRLANAMEAMLEAKKKAAEYFEENDGSLAGFKGTAMFSAADLEAAMEDPNYDKKTGAAPAGGAAPTASDKAARAEAIRKAIRGGQ